ncbi:hypothetical protein AX16_007121 [Volvariella volvacea WC 439]|nr:hypothetical protein AX16_007121 [Volvariella volvacea WC 439]
MSISFGTNTNSGGGFNLGGSNTTQPLSFGATPQNPQQPQQPNPFGAIPQGASGTGGGGLLSSFGSTGGAAGTGGAMAGTSGGGALSFSSLGFGTNANQPQAGAAGGSTSGTSSTPAFGGFGSTLGGAGAGTTNTNTNTNAGASTTTPAFGSSFFSNPGAGAGAAGTTNQPQGQTPGSTSGGAAGGTTTPFSGFGSFGSSTLGGAGAGAGTAGIGGAGAGATPTISFGSAPAAGAKPAGTSFLSNPSGPNPFGSFGSATPASTGSTGFSFGSAGAGAGAAAPAGQQQKPGLFNSTLGSSVLGSSTLGSSTLGASVLGGGAGAGGALGASTLLSSKSQTMSIQNQTTDAQAQFGNLVQQIQRIKESWEPTSPLCRFRHVFYNLVDPSQIGRYERPANVAPELWEKAVRENPDPTCLVPVIANGFDDIRERVKGQTDTATKQEAIFKELKARLDALQEKHAVNNISRLQRAQYQQTQIIQRMLAFIQHLHLLIPALRSSAMRPEEELLRTKLEEIEEELRKGRMKEKLNELWALTGAVNASRQYGGYGRGVGAGGLQSSTSGGEWAVVDEEGLAQIAAILAEQQSGLAHLTKILQKDLKDLAIITGAKEPETSDDPSTIENLWSSTSSLRISALR